MADTENTVDHDYDPDHELVERLLTVHPPVSPHAAALMDALRADFKSLAHDIVNEVPRTPDRTIALRSLHRACMDTIVALACNQGLIDG
jgi:hypothetical protein